MKVTIKASVDTDANDVDFIMTDEDLNTTSFVEIITKEETYMIHILDLKSAVDAFYEKYTLYQKHELE